MKIKWFAAFCAGWFFATAVLAQSPVSLTIDTQSFGYAIPKDFTGLGFETSAEIPDHDGVSGCLFSPTNTEVITIFTNSGIHNLRLGGGTVDGLHAPIPSRSDVDNVFGFARAANLSIIYSLPLLDADATNDAAMAKYIWDHYRSSLAAFAIGNEPNEPPYQAAPVGAITNYACYLAAWRTFAATIANVVPEAKFTGPEAGGWDWVPAFSKDEGSSGKVVLITQHEYVGGRPFIHHHRDEMPASLAIDNMLSENWVTNQYPEFFQKSMAYANAAGVPCRMTEANDYLRGVTNASNAFASALWALDYMHWWAAHGCAGINFHNYQHTVWLKTDTLYLDRPSREYRLNPKAYAIRAFDLGSRGQVKPVLMGNTDGLNLTAYAVDDGTNLYVTIINKEHGANARSATVTITPAGRAVKKVEVMFLTSSNADPGATTGITLGGAPITNHAPWEGNWTTLPRTTNDLCTVNVPATSAAVVKLILN